jgi:Cu(I)/Ag(I) efflux system membrane fusion protein
MRTVLFALCAAFMLVFSQAQAGDQKYTCPMHPHYIADEPGSCPICGMTLVPVSGGSAEHGTAGQAGVAVPSETLQLMGVRTAVAQKRQFGERIRAVGIVTENPRLQYDVASRAGGRIEALSVKAVGDAVKKGDELYRLSGADLLSAQKDYLAALAQGDKGRADATAKRLAFLGVQPGTMDSVRKAGKIQEKTPFYAEQDGVVAMIDVREGSYVAPETAFMRLQDYSSVWIEASVAEKDLPFLAPSAKAEIKLPAGKTLAAAIDYVHPTIDAATRTGKIRLLAENKDGALRPGGFADVMFEGDRKSRLAVPEEAVLRDAAGERVVVALGEGRFAPRPVRTGVVSDGYAEISEGISEGERVVVSGRFLIDAESSLRGALGDMQKGGEHVGH